MSNWTLTNEGPILQTPRMRIVRVTYSNEKGESFSHVVVRSNDSVATIIFDSNRRICFIKQMRSTTGQTYIELPAGLQESYENNILQTAEREVQEETGLEVQNVQLVVHGPSLLDPSKSDENFGVATATAVTHHNQSLDPNEAISEELIWLPEEDVFERLRNQMSLGQPFYEGMYLSGHSVYALLAYNFLHQ